MRSDRPEPPPLQRARRLTLPKLSATERRACPRHRRSTPAVQPARRTELCRAQLPPPPRHWGGSALVVGLTVAPEAWWPAPHDIGDAAETLSPRKWQLPTQMAAAGGSRSLDSKN